MAGQRPLFYMCIFLGLVNNKYLPSCFTLFFYLTLEVFLYLFIYFEVVADLQTWRLSWHSNTLPRPSVWCEAAGLQHPHLSGRLGTAADSSQNPLLDSWGTSLQTLTDWSVESVQLLATAPPNATASLRRQDAAAEAARWPEATSFIPSRKPARRLR